MSVNFKGSPGASVRLTISGTPERSFDAPIGRPLLVALRAAGLYLPSQCGGVGSCGQCRVAFEQGAPLATSAERAWIAAEDRARGVRLACQHRVDGEALIAVDPGVREARLIRARLAERRALDEDLALFVLALADPPRIEFRGGQYVQLLLPPEGGAPAESTGEPPDAPEPPDARLRAYSIASSPNHHDRLELVVRRVEHGAASRYLFAELSVGDELRLAGPFGEPALAVDRLLLLAAGAGIAPARSIALEALDGGTDRRLTLVYFTRASDPLAEELERRSGGESAFDFRRALAEEVEAAIEQELVAGTLGQVGCHVSGPPAFVDRCVRVLLRHGVAPERIRFDRFG